MKQYVSECKFIKDEDRLSRFVNKTVKRILEIKMEGTVSF
jgi:hypothetical protein